MGKSKGMMVIGKKISHVRGWLGGETEVKKQKSGETEVKKQKK
jgi:hypothetical protein